MEQDNDVRDMASRLPAGLTPEDANLIYNLEVLGMPVALACKQAGVARTRAIAPHIIQARELVKRELRASMMITREDVVAGYQDAVGLAKLMGDPTAMIIGWEKTAKILGLDAPARIDINLQASIEVQQQSVRALSTTELLKRLGAGDIIDAEFYDVG